MPGRFTSIIDETGTARRAALAGRTRQDWVWTVRDVTTGRDVAGGIAPSFEDAEAAAQQALDEAERDAVEV